MNQLATMPCTLRTVLADDHPIVREGLKALIGQQPDMQVIAEASDGLAAVDLAFALQPDVIVLDVSMPGLNGVEAAQRITSANLPTRVIALTVHEDASYARQCVAAGAVGYVLKRAAATELIRAIRTAVAGGKYIDPEIAAKLSQPLPRGDGEAAEVQSLSLREQQVLRMIAEGFSNKEIAAQLNLSVKTIETYKARSLEKLEIDNRVGLVQFALRAGWLRPEQN
jgi:two-component system, NarL family, response regulator NreC